MFQAGTQGGYGPISGPGFQPYLQSTSTATTFAIKASGLSGSWFIDDVSVSPAASEVTITNTGGTVSGPGLITESFDASAGGGCVGSVGPIMGGDSRGAATVASGSITNVRRAPTGDTSCYGSVGFGTADFLVPQVPGQYANRIYLEWGSVDVYNTLQFIGTDGNPIRFWQRFGGHANRGLRA